MASQTIMNLFTNTKKPISCLSAYAFSNYKYSNKFASMRVISLLSFHQFHQYDLKNRISTISSYAQKLSYLLIIRKKTLNNLIHNQFTLTAKIKLKNSSQFLIDQNLIAVFQVVTVQSFCRKAHKHRMNINMPQTEF